MRSSLLLLWSLAFAQGSFAQSFTLADTLRGTLSAIRASFDVTYYDLNLTVDVDNHSVSGVNHIHFRAVNDIDSFQLDLFENLVIDSVVSAGTKLRFSRLFNAFFVSFPKTVGIGASSIVSVYYHGNPIEAKHAPWDGGFVWKKDSNGKPWVGVACEGLGASSWWPCKDHLSDEPDSMRISCTVPAGLMCVSNGDPISQKLNGRGMTTVWKISYPINSYNVTLNIADYAHFSDVYDSATGDSLRLDYYVLRENLEKAKKQFQQVHGMMRCFEDAFGLYPFYRDGYALVETPYLGMEHQSAIAYGNGYVPGYRGRHPEGMDFDYIIIHETGHEWWGNSVSMKDAADMWIHESFCTYSEAVFVECTYGYQQMLNYLRYQRNFINNRSPIVGTYGLNHEGNGNDMYYKGSWMIHTLRTILDDDVLFRSILKGIAQDFSYRTVDGEDIICYFNEKAGRDLTPIFNQYLKQKDVPVLEYRATKKGFEVKWAAATQDFAMPVLYDSGTDAPKRIELSNTDFTFVPMGKKALKQLRFRDDLMLFIKKDVQ
jgi:aminopeptidase N